jgi:hypothetical protein
MKFRFLGTEACPKTIRLRGIEFHKGRSKSVPDSMVEKLSKSEYFERADLDDIEDAEIVEPVE